MSIKVLPIHLAALALVAFIAAGCAADKPMAAAPAPIVAPAPPPTDPQIAHIAATAGTIDIRAARLALSKSRNKAVRGFASDMVRDQTAVNNKMAALVKRLKVTPEDNDISGSLSGAADAEYVKLKALSGPAFDHEYISNEAAFDGSVNDTLTGTLIPNAQNPELKALLQTSSKIFQGHQAHAGRIAATMK